MVGEDVGGLVAELEVVENIPDSINVFVPIEEGEEKNISGWAELSQAHAFANRRTYQE